MNEASAAGSSGTPTSLPFLDMFIGLAAAKLTLGTSASSTVILGRMLLPFLFVGGAEDAEEVKSTESKALMGPLHTFVMNAGNKIMPMVLILLTQIPH